MAQSESGRFPAEFYDRMQFVVSEAEFESPKRLFGTGRFGKDQEIIGCEFDYDRNGENFNPRKTHVGIWKDVNLFGETFSTQLHFNAPSLLPRTPFVIPSVCFTVGNGEDDKRPDIMVTIPFNQRGDRFQTLDATAVVDDIGIIHAVEREEAEETWLPAKDIVSITPWLASGSYGEPFRFEQGAQTTFPGKGLVVTKQDNLVIMAITSMLSRGGQQQALPLQGVPAVTKITFPDPMSRSTYEPEEFNDFLEDMYVTPFANVIERKTFCKNLREKIADLGYSIDVRPLQQRER